ncbi:hypothetical protein ACJIZ3_009037 [Penstemon smallii]|uniref:Membrane-associated kinase regulator 5 n=1 Tax=Penstemon smallii TaxID=265156 RepID=A0ABD3TCH0_9LAMI
MEALGILKFWRNAAAEADDDVRSAAFVSDDEETGEEDSYFDLVIKSPNRDAAIKTGDEASEKKYKFIESPRDVFQSKNEFSNSKPSSPATLFRSTPKFKVFMLGFKKSSNTELKASPLSQLSKIEQNRAKNSPISSVLVRENSLRSKMLKENADSDVVSPEKSVPKYLKLIKPLYLKAAKKTDSVTPSSSSPVNWSPRKFSEVSRVGSFKIMTRKLGKSRSASAAVGVPPPPPAIHRRDDSLLDNGIQGAILHCKKSFNSSSQEIHPKSRKDAAAFESHHKQTNGGKINVADECVTSSFPEL